MSFNDLFLNTTAMSTPLGKRTAGYISQAMSVASNLIGSSTRGDDVCIQGGVRPGVDKRYGKYQGRKMSRKNRLAIMKAINQANAWVVTTSGDFLGSIGDAACTIFPYNTATDVTNMFAQVGLNTQQSKIQYENLTASILMNNQTNFTQFYKIYYCTLRKPLIAGDDTLTNLITNGFTNIFAPAVGAKESLADWNVELFHNPRFCQMFKINKQKHMALEAGQNTRIQLHDNRTRTLNWEYWQATENKDSAAASTSIELPGFMHLVVIFARGQPIDDNTDTNNVSAANTKTDFISTASYNYFINSETARIVGYSETFGSISHGAEAIVEQTGAVGASTSA